MQIDGDWLTAAPTQGVFAMLTGKGHQALAVGGCVRNALLSVPVADIDIATDALPERVVAMARSAGLKAIPTGIDHGTVTVVAGGIPHEITTFRRDVDTDGRHATVAFASDAAEDARRRDFTMNALYAQADGTVVDPLGGLGDLRARHVRFIGSPAARITEDYLRILRFFRFTAWYGDPVLGLDAEGLAACAEHAEGLDHLSRERVGHEMRKLLAARDPAPCIATMAQTGILMRVIPGADPAALAPLVHLEGDRAPDWLRRLAVLGGDTSDLRLSKAEARMLAALRETPGRAFALGHVLGADRAIDALLIRAASLSQPVDPVAFTEAQSGAEQPFPLPTSDLTPSLSGPQLGAAIERAKEAWMASAGAQTRADLLNIALRHDE